MTTGGTDLISLLTVIGAGVSGVGNIIATLVGHVDHSKSIQAMTAQTSALERGWKKTNEHVTQLITQLGERRSR